MGYSVNKAMLRFWLMGILQIPVLFCWCATDYEVQEVTNGKIYSIRQMSSQYTFDSARYTIFIPEGISRLQATFIHQHGCTMEGRGAATAYDLQYQAFAKKWKLAIVGPDLYAAKGNCHDWRNVSSGSGLALIKTLQEIGAVSGHPELAQIPWLLWGHSGGGYWTLSMLSKYPERIMAVFGYSPAFEPGTYPSAALKVPVMMRHGGEIGDACCWQTSIREFGKLRSSGGLVSIAYTPYQSHNYSFVRYMAIPFFEAVLRQRLPVTAGGTYTGMKGMDEKKAWLADTASGNIYKAAVYPGKRNAAAWLPDSLTAVKWREYIITGTIVDHTPPPAPYALAMRRRHNVTVELSWKADADVESGISHFNIYKGDQLVGRYPATGNYQNFDTNGDDAYPLTVPPLRTDIMFLVNDAATVSVTTVNQFGLESEHAVLAKQ